jgi:hypothetical protein
MNYADSPFEGLTNILIPAGDYTSGGQLNFEITIVGDDCFEADESMDLIVDNSNTPFIITNENSRTTLTITNDDSNLTNSIISQFLLKDFILEEAMDLDNNGIFNTNLVNEIYCEQIVNFRATFYENCRMPSIEFFIGPFLEVIFLDNGNSYQSYYCGHFDGDYTFFDFNDNTIDFYGRSDEPKYVGELSDDGNILTIALQPGQLASFSFNPNDQCCNNYINQSGEIESYEGGAIVVFEKVQ